MSQLGQHSMHGMLGKLAVLQSMWGRELKQWHP